MTRDDRPNSFLEELKRRKVVRVAIGYGAAVFVVLQLADLAFPALAVPEWVLRILVIASIAGFPIAVALSWLFDLTAEGVRLTHRGDGESRVVLSIDRLLKFGAFGFFGLTAAVLVVIWIRPRSADAVVAPGADVIAVLPFTTTGADVEVLGEGMVDLLSRNLDEVGVIRTVDSRTVLYRWHQRASDGRLPLPEALAVGADVGAGSILWGNVLEVSGQVRMNAELLAVNGERLATAQVKGDAGTVLALVDSLTALLLRAIWRSQRQPVPSIDLSAITTADLEAIGDFLAGERYYRVSQWDSAVAAFQSAIARDSLFALAYFRLGNTLGWAGNTEERETLESRAAARALELADRLPIRARSLVAASDLWVNGDRAEAADTLRAYVRRYPDDPGGWYYLADMEYHLDYEMLGPRRDPGARLETFDRALALDPSFAPSFIHPLEVAFLYADTALIQRYLGLLRKQRNADSLAVRVYTAGAEAMRRPDNPERLARALELAFVAAEAGLGSMGWQAAKAVTRPLVRAGVRMPASERAEIVERLRQSHMLGRRRAASVVTPAGLLAHITLLQGGGQLAEAAALIESMYTAGALSEGNVAYFARLPVYAGLADSTYLRTADAYELSSLAWPLAAMLAALDADDREGLDAAIARLRAAADRDTAGSAAYLARIGESFARFEAEPGVARLRGIESVLSEERFLVGTVTEPFWFRWLERMAELDETRAEAIGLLRHPWIGDATFEGPRLGVLARALSAASDPEAALWRERYLAAMADADPDLPDGWPISLSP